ncbi:hypothetical protein ACP70R_024171 [Stipagrostis hirtigluma subsp. patula]
MGSLMAGWSSPVLAGDKNKVRVMRNRSLTNEEIEAFWRQHGRPAAGDGGPGSPLAGGSSPRAADSPLPSPRRLEGIRSLPSPVARGAGGTTGVQWPSSARSEPSSPATPTRTVVFPEDTVDSPSTSRDWWTRSSWAFLNEPRAPEEASLVGGAQAGYTARDDQLHVARIVTGNA